MDVVFPGYDYTTALTIAGVNTLRCRREELTRRFFTRPTRAERDILSSLLAATKARREHYTARLRNTGLFKNSKINTNRFLTRLFHRPTVLEIYSSILFQVLMCRSY